MVVPGCTGASRSTHAWVMGAGTSCAAGGEVYHGIAGDVQLKIALRPPYALKCHIFEKKITVFYQHLQKVLSHMPHAKTLDVDRLTITSRNFFILH